MEEIFTIERRNSLTFGTGKHKMVRYLIYFRLRPKLKGPGIRCRAKPQVAEREGVH